MALLNIEEEYLRTSSNGFSEKLEEYDREIRNNIEESFKYHDDPLNLLKVRIIIYKYAVLIDNFLQDIVMYPGIVSCSQMYRINRLVSSYVKTFEEMLSKST
jgi:hypothetical protein